MNDKLELVAGNIQRMLNVYITLNPVGGVTEIKVAKPCRKISYLYTIRDRNVNIVVDTCMKSDAVSAAIVIETKIEQNWVENAKSLKFPLTVCEVDGTIYPYLTIKDSKTVKPPLLLNKQLKEIESLFLHSIRLFEVIKDWRHTMKVVIDVRNYSHYMDVVSDATFSLNRYIRIQPQDMEKHSVRFSVGYNTSMETKIIRFDEINTNITSYLNTSKWTRYGTRYEAQHQRILDLIDSFP